LKTICNICGSESAKIFDALILNKHRVDYYQCKRCGFIQTEKPYWLPDAYVSAMTALDVGLSYRNVTFSQIIPPLLDLFSDSSSSYIDYGGGYGIFVRMMRDKGYDYYLQDMYAENLFAKHFEIKDYSSKKKFKCLTSFEVFEHLQDPVKELDAMFQLADTIIFSTELQPLASFNAHEDWWYFSPIVGQHISFYTQDSLRVLSEKFKCKLYSNGVNLHMFTNIEFKKDPFLTTRQKKRSIIERGINYFLKRIKTGQKINERTSLLNADFELYKKLLNESL
jgi:2-polyprenyl-3-methyl-5-hydroxy-6-metoxy-1,4-benzoquinol methylase